MVYTISEHLNHLDQARRDAIRWHGKLLDDAAIRAAYEAGFSQGARDARNLISLHGGYTLLDPRRSLTESLEFSRMYIQTGRTLVKA